MGGLAVGLVGGLAVGLVGGLAVGLVGGLLDLWTSPVGRSAATPIGTYRTDRRTGTVFGPVVGPVVGLVGGSAAWLRLTEVVLALRRQGRVRFMRVCEDALGRQVLRQAGAVYQFRHAELQDHLAAIHRQEPGR